MRHRIVREATALPILHAWNEFGKLLNNTDAPIYRDISYLSEVWTDDTAQRSARAQAFTQYIAKFDRDCDHLMFGTDWVMLGAELNVNNYTGDVVKFLQEDCVLPDAQVRKILYDNALRFAGLREGNASLAAPKILCKQQARFGAIAARALNNGTPKLFRGRMAGHAAG